MASRRDSKAPTKHTLAKIHPAPKGRTSVAPKRPSKRPSPHSELPTADEELGRLLAHVAMLEKNQHRNVHAEASLSSLRGGLDAIREMLLLAASELDAFTRREFDLFDPKVKTLLDVRAVLLKAAGDGARLPPPIPASATAPRPTIDISELAESIESMRPPEVREPPAYSGIAPPPLPPLPKR